MQTSGHLHIVTTFPLSQKHRDAVQQAAPEAKLLIFNSITEAKDSLPDAEILLTYGEDLTPEWLDQLINLKWIQVISAGLERMPFAVIAKRDLLVTNARGIHAVPMSEYVLGMVLSIAHRLPAFLEQQQEQVWDRSIRIEEAAGKTIGILGVGAIGSAIAERAKGFGMRTIGMNTDGRPVPYVDQMVQPG